MKDRFIILSISIVVAFVFSMAVTIGIEREKTKQMCLSNIEVCEELLKEKINE